MEAAGSSPPSSFGVARTCPALTPPSLLFPPRCIRSLSAAGSRHRTLNSSSMTRRVTDRLAHRRRRTRDRRIPRGVDRPAVVAKFSWPHLPGEQRGVLYGAASTATCVAEVFQARRVIDHVADDRCLAGARTTRAVCLLDLTGDWPTRAGASQAIASGPRARAQATARATYDAYPTLEGLWYPSSMHGGHPAVVLFERAADVRAARRTGATRRPARVRGERPRGRASPPRRPAPRRRRCRDPSGPPGGSRAR